MYHLIAIYGGTDGSSLGTAGCVVLAWSGYRYCYTSTSHRLAQYEGDTTIARVRYLVIDEADRMLDMAFTKILSRFAKQLAPDCQIVMFYHYASKNRPAG